MKTYKYIALAALVLGFAACSQDYDFTPNQEDIVQIVSANIATEVKTRFNTRIGKLLTRHKNLTVKSTLFIYKVNVTGCNNGLIQLLAYTNDRAVKVTKLLLVFCNSFFQHKSVIA